MQALWRDLLKLFVSMHCILPLSIYVGRWRRHEIIFDTAELCLHVNSADGTWFVCICLWMVMGAASLNVNLCQTLLLATKCIYRMICFFCVFLWDVIFYSVSLSWKSCFLRSVFGNLKEVMRCVEREGWIPLSIQTGDLGLVLPHILKKTNQQQQKKPTVTVGKN